MSLLLLAILWKRLKKSDKANQLCALLKILWSLNHFCHKYRGLKLTVQLYIGLLYFLTQTDLFYLYIVLPSSLLNRTQIYSNIAIT